ncbi:hypothetical protein K0B96_08675 [Horticoccus luteus]|uniref:Uncharacterized protein n=1 Tax=Horticoccus luteus TaxID=2862869 RepID=A0A8F9TZK7_9BACT|nr:hypothetical protein [Horticoccus luteus]QYM80658.1 hypothetical protein K0B96_08675 [Horticoccus luteus]
MTFLFKYLWIIVRKLLPPVLLAAAVLGGTAWWLHRHAVADEVADRATQRQQRDARRAALRESVAQANQRLDRLSLEITAERKRADQADKIAAGLREQESTWDRLVGNPAQQRANAERLAKMERFHADALARIAAAETEATRLTWQRDAQALDLQDLDAAGSAPAAATTTVATATPPSSWAERIDYVAPAWDRVKWVLLGVIVAWFVLPPLFRFARWWRQTGRTPPPANRA